MLEEIFKFFTWCAVLVADVFVYIRGIHGLKLEDLADGLERYIVGGLMLVACTLSIWFMSVSFNKIFQRGMNEKTSDDDNKTADELSRKAFQVKESGKIYTVSGTVQDLKNTSHADKSFSCLVTLGSDKGSGFVCDFHDTQFLTAGEEVTVKGLYSCDNNKKIYLSDCILISHSHTRG